MKPVTLSHSSNSQVPLKLIRPVESHDLKPTRFRFGQFLSGPAKVYSTVSFSSFCLNATFSGSTEHFSSYIEEEESGFLELILTFLASSDDDTFWVLAFVQQSHTFTSALNSVVLCVFVYSHLTEECIIHTPDCIHICVIYSCCIPHQLYKVLKRGTR